MRIIAITDTHSESLAKLSHILNALQHSNETVILFHSGDLLQMTSWPTFFSGREYVTESFVKVAQRFDHCFLVPGNHDYHLGEEWLAKFCERTGFKCLVTNQDELLKDHCLTK